MTRMDMLCVDAGPAPGDPAPAVGARLPRVDGWAKVAGTDLFGADEAPADALWMRVVRSPHARARFTLGDLDAVRRARRASSPILTAKDVPGENSFGIFPNLKDQPVLAPGHVRFRGEAVLALVGTRAAVESISDADLPIAWTPETPASGIDAGACGRRAGLHARRAGQRADARQPRSAATSRPGTRARRRPPRGRFETAFVEHAYIEPEAGYAVPVGDGRPHRGHGLHAGALHGPRRDRARAGRARSRACASGRPPAAAGSAASSTCRCSRCWRSRRG